MTQHPPKELMNALVAAENALVLAGYGIVRCVVFYDEDGPLCGSRITTIDMGVGPTYNIDVEVPDEQVLDAVRDILKQWRVNFVPLV